MLVVVLVGEVLDGVIGLIGIVLVVEGIYLG